MKTTTILVDRIGYEKEIAKIRKNLDGGQRHLRRKLKEKLKSIKKNKLLKKNHKRKKRRKCRCESDYLVAFRK